MASVQQVAKACNLSPRRVQQLAKEGVLPRDARGAYDLGACLMSYIRHLQAAMEAQSSIDGVGKVSNTQQQRAKLLDVEVQREELALAKDRSEVISIADHEMLVSTLIIETKANLMAVGPRVAQCLVGLTSRVAIQQQVDKAVKEALSQLARELPSKLLSKLKRPKKRSPPAAPPAAAD